MRDLYIKNGQGFIIVYSLTSRQSFQDIKLIREQILRVKGSDRVPIVLAANKCDMIEPQREVTTDEGFTLAQEWGIPYIETSAKNSNIVNSLFTEIVKEMNIISNSYYGYGRKDKKHKKKLKKLNQNKNSSINNNNASSKTAALTNHLSASYASSKADLTASSKFKEMNGDSHATGFLASCCRYLCCCCCCCTCCSSATSSHEDTCGCCSNYGSSQRNINSCNSSYDNEHSDNRTSSCSILWFSFFGGRGCLFCSSFKLKICRDVCLF